MARECWLDTCPVASSSSVIRVLPSRPSFGAARVERKQSSAPLSMRTLDDSNLLGVFVEDLDRDNAQTDEVVITGKQH